MVKSILSSLMLFLLCACCNSNQKEGLLTASAKIESISFSKCSKMLNEELYWRIIERSLEGGNGYDYRYKMLLAGLLDLSPIEIVGFNLRTIKLLKDSYKSELWCAAYIMNGGCSDDGFEYFRCWLISQGKDFFYNVIKDPDFLVYTDKKFLSDYEFEHFIYLPNEAFKLRTNKEIYDYVDMEKFLSVIGYYPQIDFNWQEDNPQSMRNICPKVFDKF